jgi:catechol 2,3-dioxygenase-like lactoylglutathione lyase family enzyme
MIIDHLGFGVSDYARAKAFYLEVLAPLGITLVMEVRPEQSEGKVWACGFGKGGKPEFWIGSDGKTTPPAHVAFVTESRAAVRAFFEAALWAGGTTARRVCDPSTIQTTTLPSSSISTATTSKQSATRRSEPHMPPRSFPSMAAAHRGTAR